MSICTFSKVYNKSEMIPKLINTEFKLSFNKITSFNTAISWQFIIYDNKNIGVIVYEKYKNISPIFFKNTIKIILIEVYDPKVNIGIIIGNKRYINNSENNIIMDFIENHKSEINAYDIDSLISNRSNLR